MFFRENPRLKCLDLTVSFGNNALVYGIKSTRSCLP
jgi:hypothetical protein